MLFGVQVEQWVQLLTALTALIAAVGSIVGLFISRGNRQHLMEVKRNTNGILEDMVQSAVKIAHHEGYKAAMETHVLPKIPKK